jgi:hypothetical protein
LEVYKKVSKFYTISPTGYATPLLFETFEKTFQEKGHSFTKDFNEANIILFDFHSGLFDYNWDIINEVVRRRLPVVCFDQFDYYSHGGDWNINVENWANLPSEIHWARAAKLFLEEDILVKWFVRKMFPLMANDSLYSPYEVIQYPDHIFKETTSEELSSRPIDICFIGNKAAPRNSICSELAKYFKCDFVLGEQRLEHNDWLNRHRRSKLFLECGGGGVGYGGGWGSERLFQLMFISPCLLVKTEQIRETPFIDMEDCIEVANGLGEIRLTEMAKIQYAINFPSALYSIYKKGMEKMKTNYSAEYRANLILETIKKHLC